MIETSISEIDAAVSRERQLDSFRMVKQLIDADYRFKDKDEVREFFTRVTGHYKNWNYSEADSPDAERFLGEIRTLAEQHAGESGDPRQDERSTSPKTPAG